MHKYTTLRMSPVPKCQALHIVRSCLWYFYLNKVFLRFRCVISTLTKIWNFYGNFFTLIFEVLLVGTHFYTRPEYFPMAISDLNFSFPPLIVPSTLTVRAGGHVQGACAPCTSPSEKNCTRGEHFTMSNGIFNLNFLALVLSETLGGPKFTLGGPTSSGRPLTEKFLYPKRVLHNI